MFKNNKVSFFFNIVILLVLTKFSLTKTQTRCLVLAAVVGMSGFEGINFQSQRYIYKSSIERDFIFTCEKRYALIPFPYNILKARTEKAVSKNVSKILVF